MIQVIVYLISGLFNFLFAKKSLKKDDELFNKKQIDKYNDLTDDAKRAKFLQRLEKRSK